mmetsp:Transcript_69752/g.204561  ORF Transcript_69752/g.204561 Transcript_69752/m.204561 type:complete len:203 (+) Transcript_69752:20-628(+)
MVLEGLQLAAQWALRADGEPLVDAPLMVEVPARQLRDDVAVPALGQADAAHGVLLRRVLEVLQPEVRELAGAHDGYECGCLADARRDHGRQDEVGQRRHQNDSAEVLGDVHPPAENPRGCHEAEEPRSRSQAQEAPHEGLVLLELVEAPERGFAEPPHGALHEQEHGDPHADGHGCQQGDDRTLQPLGPGYAFPVEDGEAEC